MSQPPNGISGPVRAVRVWIGLISAGISYEVYALLNSVPEDTLSEGAWWAVANHPALLIPIFALIGHLFWQSGRVYEHFREQDDSDRLRGSESGQRPSTRPRA